MDLLFESLPGLRNLFCIAKALLGLAINSGGGEAQGLVNKLFESGVELLAC